MLVGAFVVRIVKDLVAGSMERLPDIFLVGRKRIGSPVGARVVRGSAIGCLRTETELHCAGHMLDVVRPGRMFLVQRTGDFRRPA